MSSVEQPLPERSGKSSVTKADLQLADFEIVKRLGDGSFSYVIEVRICEVILKRTGASYALKVVDKHLVFRNRKVESIKRERNLLSWLDDAGIVKLHFTFQDAASLYFGLELCDNGELYEQIRLRKRLSIDDARFYAAELVLILDYLRTKKVVHCDLKPENILLDHERHLKLADFGSALELEAPGEAAADDNPIGRCRSLAGTADYVAPEVLEGCSATPASDLWSLGCILYQMLHGRPPFRAASEYLTFQKVSAGEFEVVEDITEAARDLLEHLLTQTPSERIGASDMQELKVHSFFEGIDWHSIRSQEAPQLAEKEPVDETQRDEDKFDWELNSMAAALPTDYKHGVSGSLSEG